MGDHHHTPTSTEAAAAASDAHPMITEQTVETSHSAIIHHTMSKIVSTATEALSSETIDTSTTTEHSAIMDKAGDHSGDNMHPDIHSAMERIKSIASPITLADVIENLQQRLNSLAGDGSNHEILLSGGGDDASHEIVDHEGDRSPPSSLFRDPSSASNYPRLSPNFPTVSHPSAEGDNIFHDSSSNKSLKSDTIILVCTLLAMILLGLLFHRIITYFANLRQRRRMYKKGLKNLGEHMHIVTRTISNPGTPTAGTPIPGTPTITMRKLAAINRAGGGYGGPPPDFGMPQPPVALSVKRMPKLSAICTPVPDDDDNVFKPSTHVMRRDDSALGVMTTATQLRHSVLHRNDD